LNVHGKLINCISSERKLHGAEKREKCAARVDVFEPVAGLQGGSAGRKHDVLREWRAVRHTDAEVFANTVANGSLEQYVFERLSSIETQVIEIRKSL
jgi:hypothetical protein